MISRPTIRQRIAEYGDEHPEWWVALLCACAWVTMLRHGLATAPCHQLSFWADLSGWLLMVVAMMVPLMLQSLRWTAERSFRSREHRAMGGYLVGYLAPWTALGLAVTVLLGRPWAHVPWLAPLILSLAALWATTPLYTRLVRQSHRTTTLAAHGWHADRDCMRLGLVQGVPCAASCALLMLGCTLTGHGIVAMLGGAAIGASERLTWQPRPWTTPLGCFALALWYAGAMVPGLRGH